MLYVLLEWFRERAWATCALFAMEQLSFKNLREIATVLRKKINRKRLLFNLFERNTLFAILPTGVEESLIHQLCAMAKKKNTNGADVAALIVSPPKSIVKEQREEMEEDSFHCFVNKGQRASADCRRSERQACFRKTAEDF